MSKLDNHPYFAIHTQSSADPFDSLVFAPDAVTREARLRRVSAKKAADAITKENTDLDADGLPLVVMAWPIDVARKLNNFAA